MPRASFHESLDGLWSQMEALARLDVTAVERASLALLDANRQLAELVITENADIEAGGSALEDDAMQLLALQSPVAGDLRLVMSIFPLAAALVRMGGLARHVARLTRQRAPEPVVVDEVMRGVVERMGETAQRMASDLVVALGDQDTDATRRVEQADERMDGLYRELLFRTQDPGWNHPTEAAVDAALLGRFYERFADQTVDAARRVSFVLTGTRSSDAPGA